MLLKHVLNAASFGEAGFDQSHLCFVVDIGC